ncbi:nucleoporin Ndc1 [Phlebotomus argentipes]|uniref:nucleoporin Ndc1 n=1 Tax=Phlebotomus argentipes TaxID=94469 RepID=UPI0028932694|nr:nucleoporin Ndc1 [Phlebotomus argentipes]
MRGPHEAECRKICTERFLQALICSTGLQFIVLSAFLLILNFDILHPVAWVYGSVGMFFSIYTWIRIIPVIGSVIVYGKMLARHLVSPPKMYRTRFYLHLLSEEMIFLTIAHGVVGFFLMWLSIRFLPDEYNSAVMDCDGSWCYNDKYFFFMLTGIVTAVIFNKKEVQVTENLVEFPVIMQGKYQRMKSNFSEIFFKSVTNAIFSSVAYIIFYWPLVGGLIKWILEQVFVIRFSQESIMDSVINILLDWRVLLFHLIITSLIQINLHLIKRFFVVFLSEYHAFPIVRLLGVAAEQELTLAEALAAHQMPVIQNLACQDLFMIANGSDSSRRRDVFTLSIPGGHPHNWKSIMTQCLSMLNSFTQNLTKSMEGLSKKPLIATKRVFVKPTATDEAERILQTQYCEGLRIRSAISGQEMPQTDNPVNKNFYTIQDLKDLLKKWLGNRWNAMIKQRPFSFFFAEASYQDIFFQMRQAQGIAYIVQALAALTEKSIEEDRFGVVQNDLADIIKAFLQLKTILDKIGGNLMLGERRIDRNYLTLKGAVKRSLYRISNTFSPYLRDLRLSEGELKLLSHFITYKEA